MKPSPKKDQVTVDVVAELTARLAGRSLIEVKRREYDWAFAFAENAALCTSCPWRILVNGRIAHAGSDDSQQFGLPAPVDGEERVRRLLGQKVIQQITVRADTGDLSIEFSNHAALEVFNMSSGYEGWQMNVAGLYVVGTGGGKLALFTQEPKS